VSSAHGRLAGKAGVVTGTSRGLGREILRLLTAEGAAIVALSRDAELGTEAVREVEAGGGRSVFEQGDVTCEADVVRAIERCTSEFGALDLMVANAGILGEGRLHETTNDQWNELVAVHLTGAFWCCKHALTRMRAQGAGAIVTVGSILSFTADGYLAAYTAMKSGVLGLTKAIAIDYAADGIRCNCVCPGDMDTPMINQYFDGTGDPVGARKEMEDAYPGKRIADPKEVAAAVLFLCSDESSFVSGAPILVDGALTAKTY
jgi:NAD(P)-dependent dehydrogenase (short-subunit alcohol dehydrogenase family)